MCQSELIFDRTQRDVDDRTGKGFYMSGDLNRVGEHANLVSDFAELNLNMKTDWLSSDYRTTSDMGEYLSTLKALRERYTVFRDTPKLPQSMGKLDFEGANSIEKILYDMNKIMGIPPAPGYFCGESYCGESDYI